MAVGSGLAASIGFAPESVYGTYVAPTRFLEFESETMEKAQSFVQGGGLAGGRLAQLASRRAFTQESAAGAISLEVANKGMGLILAHAMGSNTTPVQQATSIAYLQTHAFGDNIGKSLTVQEGVPDLTGVVRPQTFKGGKITAIEFSCANEERLMASVELDFQKFSEAESLGAPSYVTGLAPFNFGQMNVKLGTTYGAETAVSGVKGITCRIERPQAVERFYAGGVTPATKAEPIMNGYGTITGTVDIDYMAKADFVDRFHANSQVSIVFEWVGPLIASTYYQTFRIKLPASFFTGGTPQVDGPDVVDTSVPFEVQLDGTNALGILEYLSTDTAL